MKEIIEEFYNKFSESQKNTGVNDRIFSLYNRIKELGLNKSSTVLELGCGIGALTFLLSKIIKNGKIDAVDISAESVSYAKEKNTKNYITFSTGDIVNYKPESKQFDFITLFDVIEHIPVDQHQDLFKNLSNIMGVETRLLINIPNPDYLEYLQESENESLQIVDQPIRLEFLLKNLVLNNLEIFYFEKYSIWVKNDYIFYVIEKKKKFKEINLKEEKSIIQKLKTKAFRFKLKTFYKY